jgi:lipopolysaccharide/colanic/teichoic acid biosynthesis glycosyltransferase
MSNSQVYLKTSKIIQAPISKPIQPIIVFGTNLVKRLFDIIMSLIGLLILTPVFLYIAALIKRDSPGPVFYWGPRIGRHGRVFKMLKFRTMYETAKSYQGSRVTASDDDRITPIGKWLRDTKLNELPQLWNVLVGQMSLVGPRPEDPSISKTWPIKMAREILSVRPGITSPASILYRDEENMLHAEDFMRKYLHELSPDKMRLDQLYTRYRSLWLDIDVLLWTAVLLMPKIGSYSPPEQLLFVGPVTRLMRRYISWFVQDFLIILGATIITGTAVRLFGPLNIGMVRGMQIALGFALLYNLVGMLLGSNRIYWPKATFWESSRLLASWFIATSVTIGVTYSLGFAGLRTYATIFCASILALTGIVFIRYQSRLVNGAVSWLLSYGQNSNDTRERVVIVGSGRTAEHIAWLMDHPSCSGKYRVVGFLDDDLQTQGMKIYGSKVIGRISDIPRIVQEQDVGLIIMADSQSALKRFKELRETANFKRVRVVEAPDLFGSLSGLDNISSSDAAASD